jgi:hypothetical protein
MLRIKKLICFYFFTIFTLPNTWVFWIFDQLSAQFSFFPLMTTTFRVLLLFPYFPRISHSIFVYIFDIFCRHPLLLTTLQFPFPSILVMASLSWGRCRSQKYCGNLGTSTPLSQHASPALSDVCPDRHIFSGLYPNS